MKYVIQPESDDCEGTALQDIEFNLAPSQEHVVMKIWDEGYS